MTWAKAVPLSDVAEVFNGKTPSKAQQRGAGYPVLKIKDVTEGGVFKGSFESFVDSELAERFSQKRIKPGDVLILNAAHNADYVGSKTFYAGTEVEGALATGEWLVVRARAGVSSRFMHHWLTHAGTRHAIKQLVKGIHLYPRDVMRLSFPVVEVGKQRRIAAILDKADAIRLKRQRAITLTEDLLRSTFLDLVGPGAEGYDGWAGVPVEDLAEARKGSIRSGPFGSALRHSEFVDSGIAVLGIDNAVKNRFEWAERRFITEAKYEELKRYTVFPGDVLITIMGTTGRSSVVPDDVPAAITTKHLATITVLRDVVEPEFLSHAVHMHPAVLQQIGSANRGAIMAGLNLGLIRKLEIPVPPIEAQRRFVAVLGRLRSLQEKLARRLPDDLFGSLSQRAFAGEL